MFRRLIMFFTCSNCLSKSASGYLKIPNIKEPDVVDVAVMERTMIHPEINISEDMENPAAVSETRCDKIVDVDEDDDNPQLRAAMIRNIYNNLRAFEANAKKRPCTDYMLKVQKDITIDMREILIDWLVEVAEEFKLDSETLYLTVNYIDRYLSGNSINIERLQLLGVTCMMIASNSHYEKIGSSLVKKFCDVTANTYSEDELRQMEYTVGEFLEFDLTVPTVRCFLGRFVLVAQAVTQALPVELECMINYLAELSLLDYNMLGYAPSMIAASSVFLARFILSPSKRPWNSTLQHDTLYKPSELLECVNALHRLCCYSVNSIVEKYSDHIYMYVAKKYCPTSIPGEYFQD
ncbi:Cyclin N-terminal domain-containing protein [Heracleum sosnowskyi]|uniref:Cyclin N-terminal domain-containing protein n=1 Tax=Heracleum sosnowskyi TaxID=360622 RepID=A0AAD8HFR5_9APIA|nr:Cyclin N-terminal domain-containing protein [Heracleum sosnowskyi]